MLMCLPCAARFCEDLKECSSLASCITYAHVWGFERIGSGNSVLTESSGNSRDRNFASCFHALNWNSLESRIITLKLVFSSHIPIDICGDPDQLRVYRFEQQYLTSPSFQEFLVLLKDVHAKDSAQYFKQPIVCWPSGGPQDSRSKQVRQSIANPRINQVQQQIPGSASIISQELGWKLGMLSIAAQTYKIVCCRLYTYMSSSTKQPCLGDDRS